MQEGVIIELGKKEKRSLSQNNYLYLLLGFFGTETGYTIEEAKQIYKAQSPEIFEYGKNDRKFIRSTADLNTTEMTKSIDRFRNYSSAEAGVYLPSANEKEFLDSIRLELSKNQYI